MRANLYLHESKDADLIQWLSSKSPDGKVVGTLIRGVLRDAMRRDQEAVQGPVGGGAGCSAPDLQQIATLLIPIMNAQKDILARISQGVSVQVKDSSAQERASQTGTEETAVDSLLVQYMEDDDDGWDS